MDKVKNFLEGYVQWLALALGAGFLGYTLYFYILEKPVSVPSVGTNTNVSPEDVDRLVWEGPGTTLDNAIKSKTVLPIPPVRPNLPEEAAGGWNKIDVARLDRPWTPAGVNPPIEGDEDSTHSGHELLVKKLPDAPALISLKVSSGHSNVPAPVVAGAPVNQPGGGVLAVDKNWQTVEAMVPCQALAKAFEDAKIPKELQITCMLRVVLVREEQHRDGSWSQPTTMPSLDITALKDLPDNAAVGALQDDYKSWAETNVLPICQPPFYTVLQGDVWYEPGTPNPNQANLALLDDHFDPLHPELFNGDPNLLTPKHKEQYDEYLKHKAAIDAAARARQQNGRSPNAPGIPNGGGSAPPGYNPTGGGGGNSGGNGGGGGGRGRRLGDDPQRSNPGDTLRPSRPPGYPPFPETPPGGMMPPQGQPGAANTAAAQALLPTGSFDPSQQAPFPVWAHDDTALAGHTYRYMMKYIITSPVWHSTNLCNPQTLANVFSIASADSAWTDPVNVESDTSFFAVEVKGKGIHFDIFKWKNGIWQMQTVQQATAGDMIGSPDTSGSKTDFTTGWTLVDVRDDPRDTDNRIIVLVSDNGTVKKKELTTDQRSVMYHELYEEVSKAKAAAAAGAPAAPNG